MILGEFPEGPWRPASQVGNDAGRKVLPSGPEKGLSVGPGLRLRRKT
jgi:hypothetical protein